MKKNLPYFILIIVFGLIATGVWLLFGRSNAVSSQVEGSIQEDVEENRQLESSETLKQFNLGQRQIYEQADLKFSFAYPEGFTVGEFPDEDDSETILVQKQNIGFQLYISPFDENITITYDRIQADQPDLVISDPKQIGFVGVSGVLFESENDSGEKTLEIWWVKDSHLYQITTYPEFRDTMVKILETWTYK